MGWMEIGTIIMVALAVTVGVRRHLHYAREAQRERELARLRDD